MGEYDVFVAYARKDRHFAEKLYEALCQRLQVFLDTKCLLPGDRWPEAIPAAQRHSRMTLVIVSPKADTAYYQSEEVAAAIDLMRVPDQHHRVVPLYLDFGHVPNTVPYGLRILQSIHWGRRRDLGQLVTQIESLFRRERRRAKSRREPLGQPNDYHVKHTALRRPRRDLNRLVADFSKREAGVSLIFVDIDRFEQVNRQHGHFVADSVLRAVRRLFARVLEQHRSWWLHGDQFLAYIALREREASEVGEKFRSELDAYPWSSMAPGLYVKVSLGVAELGRLEPVDNWLLRAMIGAEHAKRLGGNRVCYAPFELPPGVRQPEDYLSSFMLRES
jgi:diguanylate cyclase (GGDEF)-like protein